MAEVKHRCRLYLQFPAQPSALIEAQLAQAIAGADTACVLICPDESPIDEIHAGRLVNLVQGRGLACLIENDIELAERLGADGVHIEADPAAYTQARERLGASASIGAGCGLRRHDAMLLAEMGADYVAFGPDPGSDIDAIDQCADLIAWWAEIFVVPCVAWNVDSAAEAAQACGARRGFRCALPQIWRDDEAPRLIAEIDSAIRQARRAA